MLEGGSRCMRTESNFDMSLQKRVAAKHPAIHNARGYNTLKIYIIERLRFVIIRLLGVYSHIVYHKEISAWDYT